MTAPELPHIGAIGHVDHSKGDKREPRAFPPESLVVERDDAAELAEALKDVTAALMAADPKAHFKADVERAEAALAAYRERNK